MYLGEGVEYIINPKSIAIIGVSGEVRKAGFTGATGIMNNLIRYGYKGRIYPINPKYDSIMGWKTYKSITDLPEAPELVLIAVARDSVIPIIEESVAKGSKGAVVITSGFAEGGGKEGKQLQERLRHIALTNEFRIVGPNCLGIVNVHNNVVASTSAGLWTGELIPGKIGLISQSGALSSSFITRARDSGIGFSHIVSAGNEADLQLADFIAFMAEDSNTNVIAVFIEGIKNGDKFIEAAELCKQVGKPLVVYKVGKSERATKAAQAHTGSLTGTDAVHEALFKQKGITRVYSLDHLYEVSYSLSANLGKKAGKRLGVLTLSGGGGGVIADVAEGLGLVIPDLSAATTSILRERLPSFAAIGNPIDPTAETLRNPKLFGDVATILQNDDNIDVLFVAITAVPPEIDVKLANAVVEAAKEIEKPMFICWYSGSLNEDGLKLLRQNNLAVSTSFEAALSSIRGHFDSQRQVEVPSVIAKKNYKDGALKIIEMVTTLTLSESQSKKVLQQAGISVTDERVVQSLNEALTAAAAIGYPIAIKIDSPDITHKTDAGCVFLNITGPDELKVCYEKILHNAYSYDSKARIHGVLVQEMLPPGREVIIGVSYDPVFGPVVMFGLGGIYVEVLKDVTFRIAPFSKKEALEMIGEIKGYRLLEALRGKPRADIDALADMLCKVGDMAVALQGHIEELDINPLFVFEESKGVKAADALIIRKKMEGRN